ncbi:hypothetical protein DPMN_068838 [Dreissena polymorpha]|uniref:Uncharacterized protein n=1 Tax=Dreissena polymorpha TaxID=45954 RepID=A0A9D3Z1W6_DREPO|nr:hypothetical protein DPMN_068838 [Dreissena polymorpha]
MLFGDFDTLQKFKFLFFISLRDSRGQTNISHMIKTLNYYQKCIISGYKEAEANKNAPIHLHLSHFHFNSANAEDLIQIWKLNTSRARSLRVPS